MKMPRSSEASRPGGILPDPGLEGSLRILVLFWLVLACFGGTYGSPGPGPEGSLRILVWRGGPPPPPVGVGGGGVGWGGIQEYTYKNHAKNKENP